MHFEPSVPKPSPTGHPSSLQFASPHKRGEGLYENVQEFSKSYSGVIATTCWSKNEQGTKGQGRSDEQTKQS